MPDHLTLHHKFHPPATRPCQCSRADALAEANVRLTDEVDRLREHYGFDAFYWLAMAVVAAAPFLGCPWYLASGVALAVALAGFSHAFRAAGHGGRGR